MRFNTRALSKALLIGASTFAIGVGGLATAQEVTDQADEDGVQRLDTVVTVERRAQSLQDLAGTASVLQGEDLKFLGKTNLTDLANEIPGVQIANVGGPIEIFIRGVGSSNNTELGDPAAATHFNGVFVPRPQGIGAAFFDIQRVEVNIGPQGTLRGRNATAGSVNIIPWAPGIGVFDAAVEASYGNFNEYTVEGVVNLPVTTNSAFRLAAFRREHDSRLNSITPDSDELGLPIPTSEAEGVGVAEAADDFGVRAAYLIKPIDSLTLTVTGDFLSQQGTGFTGVNFAAPIGEGVDPDDIDNPRDVFGRAFTPDEDTEHWGIKGEILYDGPGFNVEYIGSFRDLVFDFEFVTPASPDFDGALDLFEGEPNPAFIPFDLMQAVPFGPTFDNFSRVRFITDSESIVQELRFFSDDDARLNWTVGGFYFQEDQRTFLGTTGDRNPFFSGVEFNQTTTSEAFSFYGDATFAVTDKLRVTGGVRYTEDDRERFGVNATYDFVIGGVGFADGGVGSTLIGVGQGTEGFEFAGLDRTIFNPNTDGSVDAEGNPTVSDAETLAFFFDGVAQFGERDGLDDIFGDLTILPGDAPVEGRPECINFAVSAPGCPTTADGVTFDDFLDGLIAFGVIGGGTTIALQNGSIDNSFVDWRARIEYDVTPDHLIYGLVATGNKSGSFNDNIPGTEGLGLASPVASAPITFDTDTLAPTFGEETLTLFEIGTKNQFQIGDVGITFNATGFFNDYEDLQLTTLNTVAGIASAIDADVDPSVLPPATANNLVSFTFNASDAIIAGAQFDTNFQLPWNVNLDTTILWLPVARVEDSIEIQDARVLGESLVSIEGNRLIRTPEVQINASISKAIVTSYGQFDGVFSLGYRSGQHQTIFNGIDFDNPDDPNPFFDDFVEGYVTIDLGVGYTHGQDGRWRIEGFVSNLTDQEEEQAIIITPQDNTRFFNTPRTFGGRIRAKF